LRPGGGYYGTKKACEPLHVQYSYDDRSVVVVNDTPQTARGLKVSARVLDAAAAPRVTREEEVDAPADGVVRAFTLPAPGGLDPAYFVRLELRDSAGAVVSTNTYWLSTHDDVLDWAKTKWFYTPVSAHADLTALARLPATTLSLATQAADPAATGEASARV